MAEPDQVTITLTFNVVDPDLLRRRADQAVAEHGMGASAESAAEQIVEALLHSNPGVDSYTDYGLELVDSA